MAVLIETTRAVLTQEASLSGLVDNMSPTAIFNRFDLSSSSGQHCGEYRVIYHKNNGECF
jgi:hypothetical protein